MKRNILGFGLLLALLLLGIITSARMEKRHEPIQAALSAAADSVVTDNWETAGILLQEAKTRWERGWRADAALADHAPMEEIDAIFARLQEYCREEDTGEFAAGCRELSRLVKAMTDAHKPNWWNLL